MRHQIFDATPVWSQEGIDSGDLTTENDGIPENAKGTILTFNIFLFRLHLHLEVSPKEKN